MLGGISDTIGDIAGAIGGAEGADPCIGTPEFAAGKPINEAASGEAHAHSLEQQMVADESLIEFVHFGRSHSDSARRFVHEEIDDTNVDDLDEGIDARAIMFRAAVLRETLLLHGYVSSTFDVMNEYDAATGALGDVMDTASSLMGGGGEGSAAPDHTDLDRIRTEICAAGGAASVEDIAYKTLHESGVKLHQARADYDMFCGDFLEPYYVTKDGGGSGGGGGLIGTVGDVCGAMPGVGDVMGTITGIVFKAFDLYLAMYLLTRKTMEGPIADACYDLSIDQITSAHAPIFAPWFPKPKVIQTGGNGNGQPPPSNFIEEAQQEVEGAVDDVEDAIDETKQDFLDFFGKDPDPTFGDASLNQTLSVLDGADADYKQAFRTVLDVDLPGFVDTLIEQFVALNVESLKRILMAVHQHGGAATLSEPALLEFGRDAFYHRILRIVADLVPFLSCLSDGSDIVNIGGVGGIGATDLTEKALGELDSVVGPGLNPIIELSMKQLAAQFESIRAAAVKDKGVTMEVYLARAPYLLTLMVRNTLFPVWELIVNHVFGNVTKGLSGVLSPMNDILAAPVNALNDAQSEIDDLNDTIENVTSGIPTSVDQNDIANFAQDPEGAFDDLLNGDDPFAQDDPEPPPPDFPGSKRPCDGVGIEITAGEADAVELVQVTAKSGS